MNTIKTEKRNFPMPFILGVIAISLFLVGCDTTPQTETKDLQMDEMMEDENHMSDDGMMGDDWGEGEMMEGEQMMDEKMMEDDSKMEDKESGLDLKVEGSAVVVKPALQGGTLETYTAMGFEQALASGQPVFVDVYASWCPTCRGNEAAVKEAIETSKVVAFRVDYDTDTEFRTTYGVPVQSSYLIFREGKFVKKIVGAQTTDSLLDLIQG